MDEKHYVSPRFAELALPFLSAQWVFDYLEALDKRNGTEYIAKIEKSLQSALGEEVMVRHPMA
eukprot:3649-Prorocentrum_lima.AAC.1